MASMTAVEVGIIVVDIEEFVQLEHEVDDPVTRDLLAKGCDDGV